MKVYSTDPSHDKDDRIILDVTKEEAKIIHDALGTAANLVTKRSKVHKLKLEMDEKFNIY